MQNDLPKNHNTVIVSIEEDQITKDLLLPIPQEILDKLEWDENTELTLEIEDSGQIIIQKVNIPDEKT